MKALKLQTPRGGFTLIELLVVIAIIALLSSTIFAALTNARAKARDANRIATARSLKTALALYEDKYGTVIGINGLSASASGTAILVASGTQSIADVLKSEGFLDRKIVGDTVYGTSEYYLGVAPDGKYDIYAKLERPESAMTSTTIALGSDGADALAAGYNYASGFGSGVGTGGGGVVAGGGGGAVTGGAAYVTPGTYSWTAPTGVTSVSVAAVGGGGSGSGGGAGGGLGWKNTIAVVPGNSYTVVVGAGGLSLGSSGPNPGGDSYFINVATVKGGGGGGNNVSGATGGTHTGDGGGNGGTVGGGYGAASGAGGYAGNGGNGSGGASGTNGAGGGGGGAGYSLTVHTNVGSAGGGGVGIWGQGSNGLGSAVCTSSCGPALPGGSGSSGGAGSSMTSASTNEMTAGVYGGGGAYNDTYYGAGMKGAVRIIWPGNTRLFPATSTASTTGETTI